VRKLRQHVLRLGVIWMLFKKCEQNATSFIRRVFKCIDPGQVQIRLIERGRNANAFFKARDGFVSLLSTQIKYPKIIQGFRIRGACLK